MKCNQVKDIARKYRAHIQFDSTDRVPIVVNVCNNKAANRVYMVAPMEQFRRGEAQKQRRFRDASRKSNQQTSEILSHRANEERV